MKNHDTFWYHLSANVVIVAIAIAAVGFFRHAIDDYLQDIASPSVTVEPQDVNVEMPDVNLDHIPRELKNLTYYELSLLIDAEFTAFMRQYNHYQQSPSEKLKAMMKEQAARLNKLLAFREEAWISENRQLGARQNDFTPLSSIVDDMLRSVLYESE